MKSIVYMARFLRELQKIIGSDPESIVFMIQWSRGGQEPWQDETLRSPDQIREVSSLLVVVVEWDACVLPNGAPQALRSPNKP